MTKRKEVERPVWRRKDIDIETPDGKVAFVTSLCDSIRDEVIAQIRETRIPGHWQGHELRYLLSKKFQYEVTQRMKDGRMIQRRRFQQEASDRGLL